MSSVATEAKRLDRLFPGWHLRANPDTLNIQDPRRCILRQVAYRRVWFAKVPIGFAAGHVRVTEDAVARGEPFHRPAYCMPHTRDEWIAEIDKRFA